jgi:hypothetical protein
VPEALAFRVRLGLAGGCGAALAAAAAACICFSGEDQRRIEYVTEWLVVRKEELGALRKRTLLGGFHEERVKRALGGRRRCGLADRFDRSGAIVRSGHDQSCVVRATIIGGIRSWLWLLRGGCCVV